MNRTKRHLWMMVLVIILLAIPTAVVFAKELSSLTITGPGIDGELTIDHEGGMLKLEQTGFFDQALSARPKENLADGYNITAYLNLDGKIVPFVQMVYYATDGNQPGYVHFTARLTGETLRPVDQWRRLNKDADTAFRGLMDEYKISLQPAVAAEAAPAVKPATNSEPVVKEPVVKPAIAKSSNSATTTLPSVLAAPVQVILALAVSLLILLGAGWMIRRRTESQRSSQV